jgi:hypothetical protein
MLRLESGWTLGRGSGGSEFNGWFVVAMWGIELLVFLGFGVVLAFWAASQPFCEDCGQWTAPKRLRLQGLSREAADGPIAAGDMAALVALQPGQAPLSSLALTVESCGKCRQRGWLSVEEATVIQKGGKAQTRTSKLLKNAALEPDLLARFLERAEQSAAVPVPAA